MAMGGEAPSAMAAMWTLFGIVIVFLFMRIYTRHACAIRYGMDDYVYLVASIFLLIFTIFTQLSANIGFGQTLVQLEMDMDKVTQATLLECIGQGFAIVGMAIAKASQAFFLLRLVVITWHRIAIWAAVTFVSLASVAQVLCFWLSCVPLDFVYDKRVKDGTCPIDTRPTSYILCTSTILVDLFFCSFPWLIVMPLQRPKREKYLIAGSMSLGIVAAAAGIKRMTQVEGLYSPDYLATSVGLIVWSSVEMAVTLICVGIPVCMPLYMKVYRSVRTGTSSTGYLKQSHEEQDSSVVLRTFGGGYVGKDGQPVAAKNVPHASKSDQDLDLDSPGKNTRSTIGRRGSMDASSDNSILRHDYH